LAQSPFKEAAMVGLAVFDFVPVVLFLVGAVYVFQFVKRRRGLGWGWLFLSGGLLVFLGGFLKALSKLIEAISGTPPVLGGGFLMGDLQFPVLMPGFLLMLLAVVKVLIGMKGDSRAPVATAPAMAVWKIPVMGLMTVFMVGAVSVLSAIAFKLRRHWAGVLFILNGVVVISMAGMGGAGEYSIGRQWVEEIINAFGQGCLLGAGFLLNRREGDKTGPAV
jgi:hypothetical protein